MSKIDQMAHYVLANPTITAKELAQKMGYAEQKSVYYWLDQAGYRGMKDFKKAVLTGGFPINPNQNKISTIEGSAKPSMPLYVSDDKMTRLNYSEYVHSRLGANSFAVLVSQRQAGHTATIGDILLVDPEASCGQGSIVLISIGGTANLARVYYTAGKSPIYVDLHNPSRLLSPDFVIGKVIFLVKPTS